MSSNQQLLQKADLALADMSSNGGLLTAEQARTFVRKLINMPTLIKECRTVGMGAPTRQINKIGFASRILHPATQGVASTSLQRAKPTTSKVELTTKEVMATVKIPYDVMEDNIERATVANNEASNAGPGGLRETIIQLIAERSALDLEELALLGDTGSSDAYLALQNGWIKKIDAGGNVVDFAGAAISKTLFKNGKKAMPDQYLRNIAAMRHYVSHDQETEYRDTLADRATALGDSAITGMNAVVAYGTPIIPVALMPNAKGLFVNPLNLLFGIWRQISMEFEKDIQTREYIVVLTTRIVFEIEELEATVEYKNVA